MLYTYKAIVTEVYDGDTITCDVDLGMHVWLHGQRIRLYGINTPEIRGPDAGRGKEARDYVRSRIADREITLRTHKDRKGKYGRWLGEVWIGEECLNQTLLERRLAVAVDY